MFIDKLAQLDSGCDFQQGRLRRSLSENEHALYCYIDGYLNDYCRFYGLAPKDIIQFREEFSRQYQIDLANFAENQKYPSQLDGQIWAGGRIEYDIILIISLLLEKHRFRMASWLAGHLHEKDVLCIGIGPGVELGIVSEFLGGNDTKVVGYDVKVSDFVLARYGELARQEYFYAGIRKYEAILLIEVLEHLAVPESLVSEAAKSLTAHGRLFLTTAIDIPQFDHFYNFVPGEIGCMLTNNGLQVDSIVEVGHILNFSTVRAANELVIASVCGIEG
jgi:2-polyprenyl-3-methyl-5-hydroxy-6-metoxy-1,4-benzoquinol methylase